MSKLEPLVIGVVMGLLLISYLLPTNFGPDKEYLKKINKKYEQKSINSNRLSYLDE